MRTLLALALLICGCDCPASLAPPAPDAAPDLYLARDGSVDLAAPPDAARDDECALCPGSSCYLDAELQPHCCSPQRDACDTNADCCLQPAARAVCFNRRCCIADPGDAAGTPLCF